MMLPHQITRLRQIVVQKHIARAGTFNAILSSDISERLSISEAQRKQLERKAKEIEDRLKEQISKLRTDAREELLGVLTKEQRAELDSIIGSKYEPSDKDTIDMLMERSKSKLPRKEN
jgi:F0F1-type ATP synthase membrane subunit b/b'